MSKILKDQDGNGLPQYQTVSGTFLPLVGDKAPYAQIVDGNGLPVFTSGNPAMMQVKGSSDLFPGTLVADITADPLGTSQPVSEILIQSDPDNINDILIGNGTTQVIKLKPGVSISIPCSNVNLVYVKTTLGTATVNWLGRS